MSAMLREPGLLKELAKANERIRQLEAERVPDGLPIQQEPKYTVSGSFIVNRATGEAIPHDEPVFIFRARDIHAREAIESYACVLTPGAHRDAVCARINDFAVFSYAHPERMKTPDTLLAAAPAQEKV